MWKLALIALVAIFVIADSIYLYFRLKKYWHSSSWNRPGSRNSSWKIGLASLEILRQGKPDAHTSTTGNKIRGAGPPSSDSKKAL